MSASVRPSIGPAAHFPPADQGGHELAAEHARRTDNKDIHVRLLPSRCPKQPPSGSCSAPPSLTSRLVSWMRSMCSEKARRDRIRVAHLQCPHDEAVILEALLDGAGPAHGDAPVVQHVGVEIDDEVGEQPVLARVVDGEVELAVADQEADRIVARLFLRRRSNPRGARMSSALRCLAASATTEVSTRRRAA